MHAAPPRGAIAHPQSTDSFPARGHQFFQQIVSCTMHMLSSTALILLKVTNPTARLLQVLTITDTCTLYQRKAWQCRCQRSKKPLAHVFFFFLRRYLIYTAYGSRFDPSDFMKRLPFFRQFSAKGLECGKRLDQVGRNAPTVIAGIPINQATNQGLKNACRCG